MKNIMSNYRGRDKSIYILPIGDIHIGNNYFQEKYLEEALTFAAAHRNRTRILLMGDVLESATKTSVGKAMFEESYHLQDQFNKTIELFKPFSDIIDLIIIGNHEYRVIKDTGFEIMEELSHRLGVHNQYGEFDSIVNFNMQGLTYSFMCWHGSSGGVTEASITNAMLKMREVAVCHGYLMAHTHKLFSFKRKIYVPNGAELKELEQIFVNTGTALGSGGYGSQKGFPLPICGYGCIEIFTESRKMVFHRLEDIL